MNYRAHQLKLRLVVMILAAFLFVPVVSCSNNHQKPDIEYIEIARADYLDKLSGFWLGQSLANWTGLVTEMDKIGGEGIHGKFYTRDDWGQPDQPSIWGQGIPSNLSETIDWVTELPEGIWGSDDDTDIEFIYQYLLDKHQTTRLTAEQIREGWLKHIYSDANTPYRTTEGKPENYLWVSNQKAHELMVSGMLPPDTSDPKHNPHFDMIDAQLTTEIFGLFAPTRPDVAIAMASMPIATTARENAAWAAEFYIVMYSLAAAVTHEELDANRILMMADQARSRLPETSYSAHMYDFVKEQYELNVPWEKVRDQLYQKYQIEQQGGYDISSKDLYCNGCFASGINFGASLISLFYGEGDYQKTVKLAVLMGWDSDNPAATWGGLLGFIFGLDALEQKFDQTFSHRFNIHRTRANFPQNGIYTFEELARTGIRIIDRVVINELGGRIDFERDIWLIPLTKNQH